MIATRRFAKLCATGNNFLFIDARDASLDAIDRPHLVRRLCDRHFGIGADGAIFVQNGVGSTDLSWDFYNSDGSMAEMCGNAARCMVLWAWRELGILRVSFQTIAGVVEGNILSDADAAVASIGGKTRANAKSGSSGQVTVVDLPFVSRVGERAELEIKQTKKVAWFFNTGVPHAVIEVDDLAPVGRDCTAIDLLRWLPNAGERGANATFFVREADSAGDPWLRISSVTFERGVEDFTLSCGTGVIAAALAALQGSSKNQAEVTSPGGRLEVSFAAGRPGVRLSGPAQFVCAGEFDEEFLR